MILQALTKISADEYRISVNFADDLADAGTGVTISAQPTLTVRGGITAEMIAWAPTGLVTFWIRSGTSREGEVSVKSVYSNSEKVTAILPVLIL
jgi:hypothetical protein